MRRKQIGAIFLAGILALSMAACGKDKDKDVAEATTEGLLENETDDVAEGVELPKDFENMFYPMKALALEEHYIGYPYYVQFADGSSRDSFWYSCALTTKLLNEDGGDTIEIEGENFEQIVSALFASYQKGNLEFPEIRDGLAYAQYSDDGMSYIFSNKASDYVADSNDLDQYSMIVTSCEASDDGYLIEAKLEDSNEGDVLGTYEYEIIPTEYTNGNGNPFSYSIVSMYDAQSSDAETQSTEPSTASTNSENGGSTQSVEQENNNQNGTGTPDVTDNTAGATEQQEQEPAQTSEEAGEADDDDSGEISQDTALGLIQETYGSNANYTYQGIEYVDAYPYYKFSVESDELSVSYILVSLSGNDVVGANANSDGSWSFDQ